MLARAKLAEQFTAICSAEEVERGKPAPDVYLAAARQLGVAPAACAAVEDSTNGLRAAAAAGMMVVAVPNREFAPPAQAVRTADLVLDSLEQLTPAALLAVAR